MRARPHFFYTVLEQSQELWNTLENKLDLKAPWDRLFQQVQRPEHVISELLQNADDAQASWVSLSLTEQAFVFEHNGIDFDEKSLRAICSFGISNKPFLKTIGQWGIGFKSVFSLGDRVEILTPSLAFAFEKARYIVPQWLEDAEPVDHTVIRIRLQDQKQREIAQKQIERWQEDALPLVFFNHLKTIIIQGASYSHKAQTGPTSNSQWVTLITPSGEETLLFASQTVNFGDLPEKVRENIQEQLPLKSEVSPQTNLTYSLIAGRNKVNRIYVVLPTALRIDSLPCSLNAPFIQDPGRTLISQPHYSPANCWFLIKLGELAAQTLLDWLNNAQLSLQERAQAYEILLPPSPQVSSSAQDRDYVQPFLDGFRSVWDCFPDRHFLTTRGQLTEASLCFDLPPDFFRVWDEPDLKRILLKGENQHLLAADVSNESRDRLKAWDTWQRQTVSNILHALRHPPKPSSLERLAVLWELAYQVDEFYRYSYDHSSKYLHLLPAQGRDCLYPWSQVVIPSKDAEKAFTAEEYRLIRSWVNVMDPNWTDYLKSLASDHPVQRLYNWIKGYHETQATPHDLFQKAVSAFFDRASWDEGEAIRWAWIAARLNLSISGCTFRYLCQDGEWRDPKQCALFGLPTPALESLLPPEMLAQHTLHNRYHQNLPQAYKKAWKKWLADLHKNGLRWFISVRTIEKKIWSQQEFEAFCKDRGGQIPQRYPLWHDTFIIKDFDFPDELLQHWRTQEAQDEAIWVKVLACILDDWDVGDWEQSLHIPQVYQYSERSQNRIEVGKPLAKWIFDLRQKPCVRDEHNQLRFPYEVYRQNDHTRPLKGILSFLHRDFDRPGRDTLYQALGVPGRPQDAQILMDRLRALSQSSTPHKVRTLVDEISRLLSTLSQIWNTLDPGELERIRDTFQQEPLLLAQDGTWHTTEDIFQDNPKDLPGVAVLHPALTSLKEWWNILAIPQEPTLDHILKWLRQLPLGQPVESHTLARVKSILKKYPHQVWDDVQCWLNGRGAWVKTNALSYWAKQEELSLLFEDVREQCADVSMFSFEPKDEIPLLPIEYALEWRLEEDAPLFHPKPVSDWLKVLGQCLQRVRLPEASQQARVVEQAIRLENTHLAEIKDKPLRAIPYLQGHPAGPMANKTALWAGQTLYIQGATYEAITREVARFFPEPRLQRAIHATWMRSEDQIMTYFREEFGSDFCDHPISASIPSDEAHPPSLQEIPLPLPSAEDSSLESTDKITPPPKRAPRRHPWDALWKELGFEPAGINKWKNHQGETITNSLSNIFHYSKLDPEGNTVEFFFGTEIRSGGEISLPAEVWNMLQSNPDKVTLVIWRHEKATLYPGTRLMEEIQNQSVTLYAESYRLKLPLRGRSYA